MRRCLMLPTPQQSLNDTTNSIHQIVLKLRDHLPAFGYELTENAKECDFICGHAGQTYTDIQVDVAHCHGLYPTAYPNLILPWHTAANQAVVENLIRAKLVTAPSQWVADILRRDMHIQPTVIPWGLDFHEWVPGDNQGYVLWNKTRADGVCDPAPVKELAQRNPNVTFVTTFCDSPMANVRVTGRQPFQEMKNTIRGAAVYLATTKETFGIGILEAMACGVPILGFKHGNVMGLVQHGVTGYLVEPADYDGLSEGLHYCLQHRKILGENAKGVASLFTWGNVAHAIAGVYDDLFTTKAHPKVSVVIPCHNYKQYVGEAIASVGEQVTEFGVEVIVVDDGSTDGSYAEAQEATALLPLDSGISNTNVLHQQNAGVAAARNTGINAATGDYIVCLDADDKLGNPNFLQTLADALDKDKGLGIVYTGLQMMDGEGKLGEKSQWPNGFDFDAQLSGRNQVPTCCMFRREAWRRAGGYKAQYTPAEDAELWTRMVVLGYRASQITKDPWFLYRWHDGSLSDPIRKGKRSEPDWRTDKPWVNDRIFPLAANGVARPVRNYDKPKVSVIIPVGAYHVPYLPQALDSVERQSERFWECIVVNDTGEPLPGMAPFPWAKVVSTGGHKGAGAARNLGIKTANAYLISFLDADDILFPDFLKMTLGAYQRTGRYVYTDWVSLSKTGEMEDHPTPNFVAGDVFQSPTRHAINILMRKEWALQVGGFDEKMTSWEDVEFFMNLAAHGICGTRVAEPGLIYRYLTGQRRENGEGIRLQIIEMLRARYHEWIEGKKVCNCSNPIPGKQTSVAGSPAVAIPPDKLIRVHYNGPPGNVELYGSVSRKYYGRRAGGDTFYMFAQDQAANPYLYQPIAEVYEERQPTPVPPPPVPLQQGEPV